METFHYKQYKHPMRNHKYLYKQNKTKKHWNAWWLALLSIAQNHFSIFNNSLYVASVSCFSRRMSHRRLAPQSREQPRLWLWQTQITPAIELRRPVCARKWRAAAWELKEQREDMNFPEVYFSPFFSFTPSITAQRSNQSAESECFVALQGDVNKEKEASCQAWLPVLWLWWQIDGRQGANGAHCISWDGEVQAVCLHLKQKQ